MVYELSKFSFFRFVFSSVAEPELGAGAAGAATFKAAPEPEPMFLLAGAAFFKAAPAASFRQAKNQSLVLVSNMTIRAV